MTFGRQLAEGLKLGVEACGGRSRRRSAAANETARAVPAWSRQAGYRGADAARQLIGSWRRPSNWAWILTAPDRSRAVGPSSRKQLQHDAQSVCRDVVQSRRASYKERRRHDRQAAFLLPMGVYDSRERLTPWMTNWGMLLLPFCLRRRWYGANGACQQSRHADLESKFRPRCRPRQDGPSRRPSRT